MYFDTKSRLRLFLFYIIFWRTNVGIVILKHLGIFYACFFLSISRIFLHRDIKKTPPYILYLLHFTSTQQTGWTSLENYLKYVLLYHLIYIHFRLQCNQFCVESVQLHPMRLQDFPQQYQDYKSVLMWCRYIMYIIFSFLWGCNM